MIPPRKGAPNDNLNYELRAGAAAVIFPLFLTAAAFYHLRVYKHLFDPPYNTRVVLQWMLLSFNGGLINTGGFLGAGRFVSHVTGFATLFGVDIAHFEIALAIGILSVPLFFLSGAFIAGVLIERRVLIGKLPRFDIVMFLSFLCLFAASFGNYLNFHEFGEELTVHQNYFFLSLLCLASGLQNASISAASRGTVRTTHLTGLTTDLGLGLARLLPNGLPKTKFQDELKKNELRAASIASFILGSAAGSLIFLEFNYMGFLLPSMIALYSANEGRKAIQPNEIYTRNHNNK